MAEQNNNNVLNYTGVSYNVMKSQLDALLAGDSRFENFVDSALYKIILNMFLASSDMTNYYIERTAEESFLDTAQHLSSVILNANQIGYIVRRPTPAQADLTIKLVGPIVGISAGDTITIPLHSQLTYNGNPFITKFGYKYILTQDDINTLVASGSLVFSTAVPVGQTSDESIVMLQGEKTTYEIQPENQAATKWQKYNIEDYQLSNLYSDDDLGVGVVGSDKNLTKVFIVDSATPGATGIEYRINRRSLTAEQYTVDALQTAERAQNEATIKVCLLKTNKDTTMDLFFGDDISTAIGAGANQFIRVEYFKTKGALGNQTGIIGTKVDFLGTISVDSIGNITDKAEVYFKSNLRSGADIEDKESIRLNAPAIYQALDRLVTKNDYRTYLTTLVNPIAIKYAIAWGEAEEAVAKGVQAISSLMNAVFVSALGTMYKTDVTTGIYSPNKILLSNSNLFVINDVNATIIEGSDNYGTFSEQVYFDLYVKNSSLDYLTNIWSSNSEITRVKDFLKQIVNRAQATVKNYYVPPIVQGFNLSGTVTINSMADASLVKTRIENEVYRILSIDTKFESELNISKIYDIVMNFAEVTKCNLSFVSIDADDTKKLSTIASDWALDTTQYSVATGGVVTNAISTELATYLNASIATSSDLDIDTQLKTLVDKDGDGISAHITYLSDVRRINGLTERSFYDVFAKNLYNNTDIQTAKRTDNVTLWRDSSDFKQLLSKINMMMKKTYRNSMLDEDGNIVNYSFGNEIVSIISNLKFIY
tara:strand:- start:7937 stop:10231 length:2295 start_codon:yes stop_codon:yes gene_type:complete